MTPKVDYVSVHAIEFVDVLKHVGMLELMIDFDMGTVKQIERLVDENIDNMVEREYYKSVVQRWLQQFEPITVEQD